MNYDQLSNMSNSEINHEEIMKRLNINTTASAMSGSTHIQF